MEYKRNILLSANDVVKICDFGESIQHVGTIHADTYTGTTPYMCPEVFKNRYCQETLIKYTNKADIW